MNRKRLTGPELAKLRTAYEARKATEVTDTGSLWVTVVLLLAVFVLAFVVYRS